ncbi:MAG: carboxypeptidase-like regulatory domain-containing protein [Candidatus Acidiferrales bacterium]
MRRGHFLACAAFTLIACLGPGFVSAQQNSGDSSPAPYPSAPALPALKICLRLADNSAFSGLAALHVVSSHGLEITGDATDSDGETIYPHLAPGSYSIKAVAPGFAAANQTIEIKSGHGLETLFLVMRTENLPAASAPDFPTLAKENEPFHIPPGIDEVVPPVSPGVTCDLPTVLHGVGLRMTQLVANLEKFSATEHIEHFRVDNADTLRSRESRSFDYLVLVSQNSDHGFQLDEYRDGATDPSQFPAGIATEALPVMALIFHPIMVSDFNISCEGLGQWDGRPAWQVRFEQRQDRANRIRYYKIHGNYYPVALKGRAWIDAATFQVLRLETDLVRPVKEIELSHERLSIEYGEVQFHSHELQLWLPKSAELYWERHKRSYYRRHDFSNFKVFAVDTHQKQQRPKESYSFTNTSTHDVTGILTVTPVASSKLSAVSLKFVVPAGASVLKSLGPGKDVSIPGELVESAKYVYDGPAGSVTVDANLAAESTLEVVPGGSP